MTFFLEGKSVTEQYRKLHFWQLFTNAPLQEQKGRLRHTFDQTLNWLTTLKLLIVLIFAAGLKTSASSNKKNWIA